MKRTAILAWLSLCWIAAGGATPASAQATRADATTERMLSPKGPGAVFASVEEAAVDGLLTAYLQSAGERDASRRTRGGTIHPVEGGFTYGPIVVASSDVPDRVALRFKQTDVARFHTYSKPASVENRLMRRHTAADRARVDRDPDRRPSYVLAARLSVWRYDGGDRETLVAQLPSKWKRLH